MKKCLIIAVTAALLLVVCCSQTGGAVFADTEGYDLRNDYLAEITYTNFNMAGGSIIRTFSLTFDKEYLDTFNPDAIFGKDDLFEYVSGFIQAIGFTPKTEEKGRIIGTMTYDSATDLYLEYGIDGYEKDDTEYERKNGFLYSDVFINQKTIFDGIEDDNTSMAMLLNILYMFNLERQDIALSYHYGTPYRIISSDAERSYLDTNSDIYIHEFYMDLDSANREIQITQQIPNAVNWYLLAVVFALPIVLVTLGGMTISIVRKKRRGYAD